MASILVYDRNQRRLGQAEDIEGHIVTCTTGFDAAFSIAQNECIDVVIADWTDSGGHQLAREINRGRPGRDRRLVILGRDPVIPRDAESEARLIRKARELGADDLVFRPVNWRHLRIRLNVTVTKLLFRAWLLGYGRIRRFPFDPALMIPNEFTAGFTAGPLSRLADRLGGWELFRSSAGWGRLRADPRGFAGVFETLGDWAVRLDADGDRFLETLAFEGWRTGKPISDAAAITLNELRRQFAEKTVLARN